MSSLLSFFSNKKKVPHHVTKKADADASSTTHTQPRKARKNNNLPGVHKGNIAFLPTSGASHSEFLELEEKLEQEHLLQSADYVHHAQHDWFYDANKKSKFDKAAKNRMTIKRSSALLAMEKLQAAQLPRPFMSHMTELKQRRHKKLIDVLTSPEETYEFSDHDSRVLSCPQGTLIFHILELRNVDVNSSTFIRSLPTSFYCIITIGSNRRTSKIVYSTSAKRVRIDYTAHFSIDIPEWRESPLNRFVVELWSYQDPETHFIVGSMELHAYEFIRKQHSIEKSKLWVEGVAVGKMYYEYAFTYGYFGYGHSNHLRNPKNPIMETVCHSMYPRIKLDGNDIKDKVFRARLPAQLKVFTYDSLILDFKELLVTKAQKERKRQRLEEVPTKPVIVEQVTFEGEKPVHCKLHMNIFQKEIQPDFNDTYGEYVCLGNRRARLDYLTQITQGRMKDLEETDDAAVIFSPFSEEDSEYIQKEEINHPGYLVYPKSTPCTRSWGQAKLDNDDTAFLDSFPSLRRQPGYLGDVFGLIEDNSPKPKYADLDYPLYKGVEKGVREDHSCWSGCTRAFRIAFRVVAAAMFWLFNNCWHFCFPDLRSDPVIPEISLTTPSPAGSTTQVYSYFVKDSKDVGTGKLEKIQAETAALMEISERPGDDDDESDISSSSEGDEDFKYHSMTETLSKAK